MFRYVGFVVKAHVLAFNVRNKRNSLPLSNVSIYLFFFRLFLLHPYPLFSRVAQNAKLSIFSWSYSVNQKYKTVEKTQKLVFSFIFINFYSKTYSYEGILFSLWRTILCHQIFWKNSKILHFTLLFRFMASLNACLYISSFGKLIQYKTMQSHYDTYTW